MTDSKASRFARRTFTIAAIYGVIVLLPVYFSEPMLARHGEIVTHPEYLYGFVGTALAFQLVYATIGRDPQHYRALMPIAVLAKLAFFVPCTLLFIAHRLSPTTMGFAAIDLILAALFLISWRLTRPA